MILSLLLALSQPAQALDLKWYGVGPTLGTTAVPTRYPAALPSSAQDEIDKVRGDVLVGARGVLYPGTRGRIYGVGNVGFGTGGYFQAEVTAGYQWVLTKDEEFQLLFGGGLGAGHERFGGADEGEDLGDHLTVNYFPLRADLDGFLRDKSRAYQLGLWGTFHIPTMQAYCTTDQSGDQCSSGKDDQSLIAGASYFGVGAEATLFFGDFRAKNQGNNGGGNGGGRNNR